MFKKFVDWCWDERLWKMARLTIIFCFALFYSMFFLEGTLSFFTAIVLSPIATGMFDVTAFVSGFAFIGAFLLIRLLYKKVFVKTIECKALDW